jgi:hypothetical protein
MVEYTELQLLNHDCDQVRAFLEGRIPQLTEAFASATPGRRNLILVSADLTYRMIDLGLGTGACLTGGLYSATHAIQRSMVETYANLATIYRSTDREAVAWQLAAFTHVKRETADLKDLADPLDAQLSGIPVEHLEQARSRVRARQGWFGKPARQMLADLSIDYTLYAWASEEAHGRGIGAQASLTVMAGTNDATIRMGNVLPSETIDLIANVTRTWVLESVSTLWLIISGEFPTFATVDPRFSSGRAVSATPGTGPLPV